MIRWAVERMERLRMKWLTVLIQSAGWDCSDSSAGWNSLWTSVRLIDKVSTIPFARLETVRASRTSLNTNIYHAPATAITPAARRHGIVRVFTKNSTVSSAAYLHHCALLHVFCTLLHTFYVRCIHVCKRDARTCKLQGIENLCWMWYWWLLTYSKIISKSTETARWRRPRNIATCI